ncbi:hypothetical protein SAMN02746009_03712 [Hymenobacter psychrotolerans DSM 18569]|uniref:Uncharacterized protein n=1 Tax=Hymenobacter psychrotolerans DSM 18569 TaxID=1121959 RepID=A0A1M7EY71_9BACT|nr:hypothetical protein SAMN02746009_03712 [Hymenobacter psychrotolerans DSM 18569]
MRLCFPSTRKAVVWTSRIHLVPTRFYFPNAVGLIDHVPRTHVYLHWTGAPVSSVEFRALYVHICNLLQRHQLKAILADHL